jgi:zinc protease
MTTRKTSQVMSLVIACLVASSLIVASPQAPASSAQSAALSDSIPIDPEITVGRLPNGLSYYVRANRRPEKRAELRLVVKAGSILEDDDQRGLAHIAEHMAFNGTRHFPKQEVISFLESLGMRFGAHVNAYTSFDETVYMLTVPTDKPDVMDRALLILEDWAHGISFDPAEIDKERGVVLEEWRARRGAGARMQDKVFPIWLKGSQYVDRLPIGTPEIIKGFTPDRLKKFYTDWYRPDMMAVVAVGDFDKSAVEGLIKTRFSSLQSPPSPRPRPAHDIPDHPGTRYAIATDKELTTTSVEVATLLPARQQGTVGVYRKKMVDRLFSGMLTLRLSEITQKPDAPFLQAFSGRGIFFARSKENTSLNALVKEDGIDRGLDALLGEIERVSRFGFTATELDRQKQSTMRNRERLVAEKDNRESFSRADEYIRNFLDQETLPTSDYEFALHKRFLPEITLDEVNKLAQEWFPNHSRIVIVSAPENPGLVVPDEAKLAAVVAAAPKRELKPYVDTVASAVLLDSVPAPGAITRTTTKDPVGITEWELSNGVKVVLKPTNFREDEILFRATSPGGTSLATDEDYIPASSAIQVITAGGLGKFSATDLRRLLSGKIASASPFISELEEGVTGSSSPKDLETLFQLIYLRFTQPRADATAFTVQATQMKTILANQTAVPEFAFRETLTATMSQDHLRRRLPTTATVDQWNLDKSLAFYKERFADASDFTFVFVGTFDLQTMKPLVERYLGGLPTIRRKETWRDVGVRMPTGVVAKKVEKGIEPKSQVAIVFSGPFEYDQTQRVAIRAMSEILQNKLLETIREDLGGTYSIGASSTYRKFPNPEYSITIQFGCDPQRTEALVARVLQEIEQLMAKGPTEKQVNDEREALLRDFETNMKQNAYVITQLSFKYQHGEDPATLWNVPEYYKKLDVAMIQQAAKTYLDSKNRVTVTLFPQGGVKHP